MVICIHTILDVAVRVVRLWAVAVLVPEEMWIEDWCENCVDFLIILESAISNV